MSCLPDTTAILTPRFPDVPLYNAAVLAYSKNVQGGARRATLELCSADYCLNDLLHATVEIQDTLTPANRCWCGYIAYLYRCCSDTVAWGLTGDFIRNRIAVSYTRGGTDYLTDFVENAASITLYGLREVVAPLPKDSLLSPDQYRDRLLTTLAYPLSFIKRLKGCQCDQTTLIARGWWDALDWELYNHPRGYAHTGATSTSTQPFGQGVTSNQIGHLTNDNQYYVSILTDDFAHFKGGEPIIITGSGSAENNQVTTISTKLSPKQVVTQSGTGISFDPANDIYVPDASRFVTKEMIYITGATGGNNGYKWIKKVYVIGQNRLEIFGGGISSESGNPNVTITAGTTLRIDDAVANEDPGATITVKNLAQYVCQPVCNPCDEAWPVNHAQIKARKVGNPTDDIIVDLCTDCNTIVSTANIPASAIIDRTDPYDLYFPTPVTIPAGGCLYLRIYRAGAVSMTDYYELQVDTTDPRLLSAQISPDGVTWYDPATPFTVNAVLLQDVEVTTQAQLMGQSWSRINQVFVNTSLNFTVPVYRNGWRSIRYELERLIALGTPDGRRLTCTVDCDRNLIIDAEPLQSDGCLTINCNTGFPVDEYNNPYVLCALPAGFWACPTAGINDNCPDYERSTFIEEWEMDYGRCRVNYTSRTIDLDALGLIFKYQGIG